MKIKHEIISIQLDHSEWKKIAQEFKKLKFEEVKDFYKKYPNINDLFQNIDNVYQSQSLTVDRKLNTY